MVKVLPEPVTPSSTWVRSLRRTPSTRSAIAVGWSPFGSKSDLMTKRRPPSDLSGRGGRCGVHNRLTAEFVAALAQQAVERLLARGAAEGAHAAFHRSGARRARDRVSSPYLDHAAGVARRRPAPRCPSAFARSGSSSPGGPGVLFGFRHSPAAAPRRTRAPPRRAPDAHWRNRRGGPRNCRAVAAAPVCEPESRRCPGRCRD